VIIDCKKERLAVNEANKLNIPIIALTDTNCDPDTATWVIPGNDDAIRAVRLVIETLTEGIREGQQLLSERELRERQEATARAALEQATMEAAAAEEASPAVASETGPSAEEAKAEAERTAPEAAAHA
jgi:small subunit ribosomal protein S2